MESYNTLFRYFFPILFFLQYFGCDSYNKIANLSESKNSMEAVQVDCSDLKKDAYNGFYAPSEKGKLFKRIGEYTWDSLHVAKQPIISMKDFKLVRKTFNAMGRPSIQVTFTENGKQLFKEYTAKNTREKVAVIVRDKLIMAPVINAEVPGGVVEISGNFTQEEVDEMYVYLYRMLTCAKATE